jgi:hypothetical protein
MSPNEGVLRQFKPKLAITVYHDFKDFWEIPQFLDRLGLGYRFTYGTSRSMPRRPCFLRSAEKLQPVRNGIRCDCAVSYVASFPI